MRIATTSTLTTHTMTDHKRPGRRQPLLRAAAAGLAVMLCAPAFSADPVPGVEPSCPRTGERGMYQPPQICRSIPKFDYTDQGRAIMLKRYPLNAEQNYCQFLRRYRWVENTKGIHHVESGWKFKRQPLEVLSETQKAVLAEWGQPNYVRGPYKSTRGDLVIEWAYHPLNHIFQWVERRLVYEGPLTDQDRTSIVYGTPRDVIISQHEPNIRRETWIYHPTFRTEPEQVFSFTNGKLTYSQEEL